MYGTIEGSGFAVMAASPCRALLCDRCAGNEPGATFAGLPPVVAVEEALVAAGAMPPLLLEELVLLIPA